MTGPTQRDRILKLLEERKELGVTNYELNEIAFRYGARLKELREDGYQIKTVHIRKSVWLFVLVSECTCGYDPATGFRFDIACPVHDQAEVAA